MYAKPVLTMYGADTEVTYDGSNRYRGYGQRLRYRMVLLYDGGL